ncbi:MAG: hypothetical protein SFW64_04415 [Alphaproteobacteria bacterium]|nr:hypothetical protein [Alphaproteobacteria bacterium]
MADESTALPPTASTPTETTPPAAVAEGIKREENKDTSLVEQIDFNTIYDGLEKRDIKLSLAERMFFEKTTRDKIKKQNNGELLGTNHGGDLTNILQVLFSFIQKLLGGETGPTLTASGIGDRFTNAADGATNQGKQYVVNVISANISLRLQHEGGNLARAADLMTGFTTDGYARYMPGSISEQLATLQGIPAGTTSTLNRVADASAGHGLPNSTHQRSGSRDLS